MNGDRCPDIDADGARCGDVEGHDGRHSWHPSVEGLWERLEAMRRHHYEHHDDITQGLFKR